MKPKTSTKSKQYDAAATKLEDGVARICRLYGVSPLIGRLYVTLFLAPEPLSLEELVTRVGTAKSTTSVALRKLLSARVVRRLPPRGDRRDFYEAVTDPWVTLADWTRLYFQPELAMWRETSTELSRALGSAEDAPKGHDKKEIRRRLEELSSFATVIDEVLGGLKKREVRGQPGRTIRITRDDNEEER